MNRLALPAAILFLTFSVGCPVRPKTEETDDAADESGGPDGSPAKPESDPGDTTSTGGEAPLTCEQELEQVKAALEACEAAS